MINGIRSKRFRFCLLACFAFVTLFATFSGFYRRSQTRRVERVEALPHRSIELVDLLVKHGTQSEDDAAVPNSQERFYRVPQERSWGRRYGVDDDLIERGVRAEQLLPDELLKQSLAPQFGELETVVQ